MPVASKAISKPKAGGLAPETLDRLTAQAAIIFVELAMRWRDCRAQAAASLDQRVSEGQDGCGNG